MMATFGLCCISSAASMKQSSGTLVSESMRRTISPLSPCQLTTNVSPA